MYHHRETFQNGTLPTQHEVLEYLITLRNSNQGNHENNIHICSKDLVLQWIFCNVYPHSIAAVVKSIEKMDNAFKNLKRSK